MQSDGGGDTTDDSDKTNISNSPVLPGPCEHHPAAGASAFPFPLSLVQPLPSAASPVPTVFCQAKHMKELTY